MNTFAETAVETTTNWEAGLDFLLAPMTPGDFLARHWNAQRPVHIPGTPEKFAGLFDRAAFLRAIREVPVNRSIHLKAVYTAADETSTDHGCLGAEEALRHFDRGATLCATAIDVADTKLAAFRDVLRRQLVSPDALLINCYYSPDGQGFGAHFDSQSVWVMQIEGTKRWRYSKTPAVDYPSNGANAREIAKSGYDVPAPDLAELECVDLKPGDVLYLPPGTWHRAEALGPSLALSLTQPHEGTWSLFQRALRTRLNGGRNWRQHFPPAAAGGDAIDAHLAHCLEELKREVAAMSLAEMRELWYAEAFPKRLAEPAPVPPVSLDPASRLRLTTDPLLFPRTALAVTLYFGGRRYALPHSCRTLFTRMSESGELTAAEAAAILGGGWQDARELLLDLLQIGVVGG